MVYGDFDFSLSLLAERDVLPYLEGHTLPHNELAFL